jgi:C_GCAxxG_C_C family probable redox protein
VSFARKGDQLGNRAGTRAVECLKNGFNCAEGVFKGVVELFPDHCSTPSAVATGFGGGISGGKHSCGALTGAAMAVGALCGRLDNNESSREASKLVRTVYERFESEFGHIDCNDLTGHDISTPEGYNAYRADEERFPKCCSFVEFAARTAAQLAAEHLQTR